MRLSAWLCKSGVYHNGGIIDADSIDAAMVIAKTDLRPGPDDAVCLLRPGAEPRVREPVKPTDSKWSLPEGW